MLTTIRKPLESMFRQFYNESLQWKCIYKIELEMGSETFRIILSVNDSLELSLILFD